MPCGFFVNTLALRIDVSGAPTASELLARVKAQTLSAQEHQGLPFEPVVKAVHAPRSLAHAPVFQVMFAWQNAPQIDFELPGLRVSPIIPPHVTAKFDLLLSLEEEGEEIAGGLEYATALFDRKTIERYLGYWRNLLEAVAAPATAEITIGRLPMVSAEERAALVRRGQGERVVLPETATLSMLLAQQAVRSPNAIALVCGRERLTYAELHARADQVAHRLVALGVGPDTLVGISLPRTIILIVAIIAIHKAGGAYLPLDPSYPEHRLVFMVEDSSTKIILTDRAGAALLARTGAQFLRLDEFFEDAREFRTVQPGNGVGPRDLAYVLYTSGSTGSPKGIAATHGGAVNLILSSRSLISDEDISGVLFSTSLNFDISVYEIFLPLAFGGAIVIVDTLFGLTAAPARDEVSLVNTVPSLMSALLKESTLPVSVRLVNFAGEALPRGLADQIFADRPDVRLFNLYGPTDDDGLFDVVGGRS